MNTSVLIYFFYRARLTLPSYLRVVDDAAGSIRVIAKEFIPRKTQFDAFEARKTTENLMHAGVFALKVSMLQFSVVIPNFLGVLT